MSVAELETLSVPCILTALSMAQDSTEPAPMEEWKAAAASILLAAVEDPAEAYDAAAVERLRPLAAAYRTVLDDAGETDMTVLPYCERNAYEHPECLVRRSNVEALNEDNPWAVLESLECVGMHDDEIESIPATALNTPDTLRAYVVACAIVESPEDAEDALTEYADLCETRDALENYPLYDEEHHSHLEMIVREGTWKEDASEELAEAILKHLGIEDPDCIIAEAIVEHDEWGIHYAAIEAWTDESTFLDKKAAIQRLGLDEVCAHSGGTDVHVLEIIADAVADAYPDSEDSSRSGPYLDDAAKATLERAAARGYYVDRTDVERSQKLSDERVRTIDTMQHRITLHTATVECQWLKRAARMTVAEVPQCEGRCGEYRTELLDTEETWCEECLPDMRDVLASYRAWNDPWIKANEGDVPALREAYNDHLDALQKEGEISPLQAHNAENPY